MIIDTKDPLWVWSPTVTSGMGWLRCLIVRSLARIDRDQEHRGERRCLLIETPWGSVALALKAIIQYLLNVKAQPRVTLEEICCSRTLYGQRDFNIERYRYFMRFNASPDVYEKEYDNLRDATQRTLDERGIDIPSHFREVDTRRAYRPQP